MIAAEATKLFFFQVERAISFMMVLNRGGGQNLERRNVERSILRNFKIANIKITIDEFFLFFINYLDNTNI